MSTSWYCGIVTFGNGGWWSCILLLQSACTSCLRPIHSLPFIYVRALPLHLLLLTPHFLLFSLTYIVCLQCGLVRCVRLLTSATYLQPSLALCGCGSSPQLCDLFGLCCLCVAGYSFDVVRLASFCHWLGLVRSGSASPHYPLTSSLIVSASVISVSPYNLASNADCITVTKSSLIDSLICHVHSQMRPPRPFIVHFHGMLPLVSPHFRYLLAFIDSSPRAEVKWAE